MERYFSPGFKKSPSLHVGSQSLPPLKGLEQEQAWEGFHLAAAKNGDAVVVRDFDEGYIRYWKKLMGDVTIYNLHNTDKSRFLSEALLKDKLMLARLKAELPKEANLMVFFPTRHESMLADRLGITLHGSVMVSETYGTKTGIRRLANRAHIPMAPGFICTTANDIMNAVSKLKAKFSEVIIKREDSFSGYYMRRVKVSDCNTKFIRKLLSEITPGNRRFEYVVEGWVKAKKSLCAHIEILPDRPPIICAAWEQLIDNDGISYMGSGPLRLNDESMRQFCAITQRLAVALKNQGATGSYGPDFLVIDKGDTHFKKDSIVLTELNARVPFTAFPLEIITQVKGRIGTGFISMHIKTKRKLTFRTVKSILRRNNLLIEHKGRHVSGVIPFNVGLLPWNLFDVVVIAKNFSAASKIAYKLRELF